MTSQHVIHVQGLEKSYKKLEVLRGVDFDVARGSIFALLGSNGAGKTTVVKILSTLLKADAGTASVNGFDVATQAADVRESISLTGQFAAVDEILSGRENLVLVARLRHLKDPGTIADDLLDRFSLTDAAARKVSTYSGGMRRRLDIARASSEVRRSSSSTSRRPGSTPRRASRCGRPSRNSPGTARRCCSRRRISTRPNDSPTGSRSSTGVESS
jgi:ABC-2 type transport system ATP-binding protein